MIAEFSIVPIGSDESLSQYVAECIKIVKASGLRYELTPMGTILQGPYDDVMSVIGACHIAIRKRSRRVLTSIKIDDRMQEKSLEERIASVERKL